MSAKATTVLAAIVAVIEAIPAYAGGVRTGNIVEPWRPGKACVALRYNDIASSRTSDRLGDVPLTQTSREMSAEIQVWIPASGTADAVARQALSLDAQNTICRALEASANLTSSVLALDHDPQRTGGAVVSAHGGQFASTTIEIVAVWRERTGGA